MQKLLNNTDFHKRKIEAKKVIFEDLKIEELEIEEMVEEVEAEIVEEAKEFEKQRSHIEEVDEDDVREDWDSRATASCPSGHEIFLDKSVNPYLKVGFWKKTMKITQNLKLKLTLNVLHLMLTGRKKSMPNINYEKIIF